MSAGWSEVLVLIVSMMLTALGMHITTKSTMTATVQAQTKMHTENTERLNVLAAFQAAQLIVNGKRDEQIALLREQTATLTAIGEGLDRRLKLIEDRTGA